MTDHNLNDPAARNFLDRLKGFANPQELGSVTDRSGGTSSDEDRHEVARQLAGSGHAEKAGGVRPGSWVGSFVTLVGSIGILLVLYLSEVPTGVVVWNLAGCGLLILVGATWDVWRGDRGK